MGQIKLVKARIQQLFQEFAASVHLKDIKTLDSFNNTVNASPNVDLS